MQNFKRGFGLSAMLAILAGPVPALAQEDVEARKARILANLKLQAPQLEQMNATVGELGPSEFSGLDQGTLNLPGRGVQNFFVSRDDKKLWMVQGQVMDVSLSQEQIQAKVAERRAEEARQAAERTQQLADAVAGVPYRGKADAPVTIVEFSDFQCPYCSRGATTMSEVLQKYPNDVKLVFKHFPLAFHNWAKPAAIASHCAAQQDGQAFWLLHDKYFQDQRALTQDNVLSKSKEYLQGAKLDLSKWSTCAENLESAEYKAASAAVDGDMALGQKLGVSGTPGFFVNGQFLNGAQPLAKFEPLIEDARTP